MGGQTRWFGAVFFVLAVAAGCTEYVEETTPPGEIPPPRSVAPVRGTPASPDAPGRESRQLAAPEGEDFQDASLSVGGQEKPPAAAEEKVTVRGKRIKPPAAPGSPTGGTYADASNTTARSLRGFSAAYEAKQRPRIATFFNRALSSEVREWRSAEEVRTYDYSTSSKYTAAVTETAGARESPGEPWVWAFEEGFSQALLGEQVRVVDRATILRLTAAAVGPSASLPTIEIEALKSYADILVELLIVADPESPLGYSFRATAKDVKTGELLVSGTLLDWSSGSLSRPKKKAVVTDKGYELVADVFPSVREVGGDLARGVMLALEDRWRR